MAEEGKSAGVNSGFSNKIKQDQDPEFGQHDMQKLLSEKRVNSEGNEAEEDGINEFFGNIRSLRAGNQSRKK